MPQRPSDSKNATHNQIQYLNLLVELFEQHGWSLKREQSFTDKGIDVAISKGSLSYAVVLKVSSESRRDRLVALLSQAILEARTAASRSLDNPAPLAVVAAPSILKNTAGQLIDFRSTFAPDAAVGIIDLQGLQRFVGSGLEMLLSAPPRSARRKKLRLPKSANLFSDLNQWMLKLMLAPLVSERLLEAPRGEYRNASELAEAAQVSVMSAFRLIRQLEQDGFLDAESETLRLVHREELMRRWQAAYLRPVLELPLLRIDPNNEDNKIAAALHAFNGESSSASTQLACLGLTAAARCLGFEAAELIPPSFYLESLDREVLAGMGFSPDGAEFRPDLFVRQPVFRKSVFKAAVTRNGILISDVIQIWLDITSPLGRDKVLADEIRGGALAQVFAEQTYPTQS